jgi:hypothetical protein
MRRRVHEGSGSVVITGRLGLVSGGGGRHQHLKRLFSDDEFKPKAAAKLSDPWSTTTP